MLPILAVLLLAQLGHSLPTVSVTQAAINDVALPQDVGGLVNRGLIEGAQELYDGGDTSVYVQWLWAADRDLAALGDARSQAGALARTVAALAQLAPAQPGDACPCANLIESYVRAVTLGDAKLLRSALRKYLSRFEQDIDLVVQLAIKPQSLRNQRGAVSDCADSGRSFPLEAAWDAVLDSANPYSVQLLNEQYCASRRLALSPQQRSNSLAAAVTAASLPPVTKLWVRALQPAADFVRAAVSGKRSVGAAASALKLALRRAAAAL